ncbi:MAG: hypothetical protein NPINA01_28190 [Nitrospinaceae bacterium]|nr:MAG: hypothetical protein NPINA01_28190 [Nitrospinaceae bacterium]
MKRFFKVLGWVCLGIFLQFKFNVLYGIVFLENLNFHDRTYIVKMGLTPVTEGAKVLNIETTVHHSLGSDYFATVYIPIGYKVLNQKVYQGTEAIEGYQAYQMNMKRRYRDVLATADFIISPEKSAKETPANPILVQFENLDQLLHKDSTYLLSIKNKQVSLEGPEMAEAKYPQKFGM